MIILVDVIVIVFEVFFVVVIVQMEWKGM